MPMYNLIEYSDNYQDSSATLYQYKLDEPPEADPIPDLTADNSSSFKYKINLLGDPDLVGAIAKRNIKIVALLKYLSNFFRSLEMPLINCKLMLVMLYLLLIQNYAFQLLLCQKKIIKILLNNKIKGFKDLFIGTNIKQKNKKKLEMLMPLNILI